MPLIVNKEQNDALFKVVMKEEVRIVTFQLKLDKAPRLDNFLAIFFQNFWDIIGDDLTIATKESRKKMTMLGVLNHTLLTFVPKKKETQMMRDLMLIDLCNMV